MKLAVYSSSRGRCHRGSLGIHSVIGSVGQAVVNAGGKVVEWAVLRF